MDESQINHHKRMAMGEGYGEGTCESPFKSGINHDTDGTSRKRALKDGKRSHDGVTRHPDHGPHDMRVPNPRTD